MRAMEVVLGVVLAAGVLFLIFSKSRASHDL
jgi:hypothetical protein